MNRCCVSFARGCAQAPVSLGSDLRAAIQNGASGSMEYEARRVLAVCLSTIHHKYDDL